MFVFWSTVKIDRQACLELIDGRPGGKAGVLAALDDIQRFTGGEANTQFLSHLKNSFAPSGGGLGAGRYSFFSYCECASGVRSCRFVVEFFPTVPFGFSVREYRMHVHSFVALSYWLTYVGI